MSNYWRVLSPLHATVTGREAHAIGGSVGGMGRPKYLGMAKGGKTDKKYGEMYELKGLIVLGVPSNQFGGQEPGSNKEIKRFCEVNFNVNFPMTDKVDVKGTLAHPIFLWAKENHGTSAIPKWNFHKILINKDGKIQDTYSSLTKPTSKKITDKIEKMLNIE